MPAQQNASLRSSPTSNTEFHFLRVLGSRGNSKKAHRVKSPQFSSDKTLKLAQTPFGFVNWCCIKPCTVLYGQRGALHTSCTDPTPYEHRMAHGRKDQPRYSAVHETHGNVKSTVKHHTEHRTALRTPYVSPSAAMSSVYSHMRSHIHHASMYMAYGAFFLVTFG